MAFKRRAFAHKRLHNLTTEEVRVQKALGAYAFSLEECDKDDYGTVYFYKDIKNIRIKIKRGTSSLCTYLGFKKGHPFFGREEGDEEMDDICKVFSEISLTGPGKSYSKNFWWIVWTHSSTNVLTFDDLYDIKHLNKTHRYYNMIHKLKEWDVWECIKEAKDVVDRIVKAFPEHHR